jgi:hypothetical protein
MPEYHVWERGCNRGRSTGKVITAPNIYKAVEQLAGTNILNLSSLQYLSCGTSKSNPGRFIASDGSAREFTAYEIHEFSL